MAENSASRKTFVISGNFTEKLAGAFQLFVSAAEEAGETEAVVYVNSRGGSTAACAAMISAMKTSHMKFHVCATGFVMSAGLLFLSQGDVRYASEFATCMYLKAWLSTVGDEDELKEDIKYLRMATGRLMRAFFSRTKKTAKWWNGKAAESRSGMFFFAAKQAMTYGVVDSVSVPHWEKTETSEVKALG